MQSNNCKEEVSSSTRKIDPSGRRVGLRKKYASCRELRSAKDTTTTLSFAPLKLSSFQGNSSVSATCMDSSSNWEEECEQIIHKTIAQIDGTAVQQPPMVVAKEKRSDHLNIRRRRTMDQLLTEFNDIWGNDVGW